MASHEEGSSKTSSSEGKAPASKGETSQTTGKTSPAKGQNALQKTGHGLQIASQVSQLLGQASQLLGQNSQTGGQSSQAMGQDLQSMSNTLQKTGNAAQKASDELQGEGKGGNKGEDKGTDGKGEESKGKKSKTQKVLDGAEQLVDATQSSQTTDQTVLSPFQLSPLMALSRLLGGLPAVTHFTPVVGLDVHMTVPPSGTPPTGVPLLHPHVGFVLDLREYVNAALAVIGCIALDFVEENFSSQIEWLEGKAADVMTDAMSNSAVEFVNGVATHVENFAPVRLYNNFEQEKQNIINNVDTALGGNVGQGAGSKRPIFINGLMRTTVGTHTFHLPGLHFPEMVGGALWAMEEEAPKPSCDAESYMGSKTVIANGDPLSFLALPALSCWFMGQDPPDHNNAHQQRKHKSLPTSFMLPIPAGRPVLVGGPPIMNMLAALHSLQGAIKGKIQENLTSGESSPETPHHPCTGGEPVHLITGEVVMEQRDFTVNGRLPLEWTRYYASQDGFTGIAGAGWRTLADTGMEVVQDKGQYSASVYFADHVATFDHLSETQGWANRTYDRYRGHAFYLKDAHHAGVRTREGLEYGFTLPEDWRERAPAPKTRPALAIRMSTFSDLNGNAWHFEWSSAPAHDGMTLRITEWWANKPTGRLVHCAPGAQTGRVGSITLRDKRGINHALTHYEQDDHNNLVAARDAMGNPYCFEYAAQYPNEHLMVRHTNRNGLSFYYNLHKYKDGKWRCDHSWGDNGMYDYRFTYDLDYLETRYTDSLGHESVMQYDDRQLPIMHIDGTGGIRSYEYDARRRTIAEVDEGGNITRWEYDDRGNVLVETRADYSTVRTEYDENNRAITISDPENGIWKQEWDERGNLVKQTTPKGISTQYCYDDKGQLTEVTDAAGATTTLAWDDVGNLRTLTDPQNGVTELESDGRGNVVQSQAPGEEPAIFFWDQKDRMTACILPGRNPVKCTYSPRNELIRYEDEAGQVTTFGYYGLGHLASRTAPDGSTTRYHYDTEEQLTGVTNAVGRTWHLDRDAAGRLIGERDYWGRTRRYGYDAAGRLARVEDGAGKVTQVQCDRMGRIVQRSSGSDEEHFTWNRRGQLTEALNAAGKVTRRYDADGRLTQEQQAQEGFTGTIENHYDAAGRLDRQQRKMQAGDVRHQQQLAYGYDALGRMQTVQVDKRAPVKLNRDEAGRLAQVEFGGGLEHHLSYDAAGRLTRHETRANKPLHTYTRYGYDLLGRQTLKVDSRIGEDNYEYDPLGRIRAHTDPLGKVRRFMHNAQGDAVLREWRTKDGGRLVCHASGVNWRMDAAGQVTIRSGATNEDQSLAWDGFGRLKSLKPRNGHWHYWYDALGRRIGKRNAESADCTWFLWEGDRLAGEVQQTGGVGEESEKVYQERYYVYHQGSFEPLLMQDSGWHGASDTPVPKVYAYQNDPNGAPVRLCNGDGDTMWEGHYAATGRMDYFAERTVQQHLRLQGQYFDEESGLHYNRHRYYDPLNGQFVSMDPIGLLGGWNPYEFGINTIKWADPRGLKRAVIRTSAAIESPSQNLKYLMDNSGHNSIYWIGHSTLDETDVMQSPAGGISGLHPTVRALYTTGNGIPHESWQGKCAEANLLSKIAYEMQEQGMTVDAGSLKSMVEGSTFVAYARNGEPIPFCKSCGYVLGNLGVKSAPLHSE